MRVDPHDGRCRQCEGELEIIEADDATITVQCLECGETYLVETDAFGDGAIHYYPHFVVCQLERRGRKTGRAFDNEAGG